MLPEQMFSTPVSGPAYRPFFRYFTFSTLSTLATYGVIVFIRRGDVATPIWLMMAAAAFIVLLSGWYILTGRTTVDSTGVRQDWMFEKSYRWHEIARARVVRMPGSVRLVFSTGAGPLKAIHSGSRELDQAFAKIADFYRGASQP